MPQVTQQEYSQDLYGMPAFSDEFQAQLEAGRNHIGGCCINGARTGEDNGSADKYCRNHIWWYASLFFRLQEKILCLIQRKVPKA